MLLPADSLEGGGIPCSVPRTTFLQTRLDFDERLAPAQPEIGIVD
jgi:hypothetical protein